MNYAVTLPPPNDFWKQGSVDDDERAVRAKLARGLLEVHLGGSTLASERQARGALSGVGARTPSNGLVC